MSHVDPSQAPAPVREAFEWQAQHALGDNAFSKQELEKAWAAAELWESLRQEAAEDDEAYSQVVLLDEESTLLVYDLADEVSRAFVSFVRGYFGIPQGSPGEVGKMFDELDVDGVRHGRSLIGARVAFAIVRSLEVDPVGLARINPARLLVRLVDGSIQVDQELTEEEQLSARVRWMLGQVTAAAKRPPEGSIPLYQDEREYAEALQARLMTGWLADEQTYADVAYLHQKVQPHEKYFANAKGVEKLVVKQRARAVAFLGAWREQGDPARLEHHERQILDGLQHRLAAGEEPELVIPAPSMATIFRIQSRLIGKGA